MKKILLLILAIVAKAAISQTTQFTPAMTNTLGGSGIVAGTYYDYTVGEPIVLFGGTCDSIFSGFQHMAEDTLRIKKVNINVGGTTIFCLGGHVTLTAPTGVSYLWSTGATTQAITVAQTTQTGSYHVRVTNTCGDTIGSKNVVVTTILPQTPQICVVTTDSASNYKYNIIYWNKTGYSHVDSFIVFRRDNSSGNYLRIGAVSKDSLSAFKDTVFNIGGPNGGNPQIASWKYKLAIKDTCNNIGPLSPYHQSIFVTQSGPTFNFTTYIDSANVNLPTGYSFLRDDNNTGSWHLLANIGGSPASDPNYNNYPNGNWRVDALGFNCTPTIINPKNPQLLQTVVNTSKSNTFRINNPTFVVDPSIAGENIVNVYPNPNNGAFQVAATYSNSSIKAIEVYSV